MNFMIIDMTNQKDTLISLGEYLGIYPEDILEYIAINKDLTVDDFIEHFSIDIDKLLEKELYLCCLHVTTNNDECKSIKEYGIINLRDSIKLSTPLGRYLNEKGVEVDIENKKVKYNGKEFDVSLEKHESMNEKIINYKLFKDYQINAFFSNDNVLNYGGGARQRPEILYNLSKLLSNTNIENDWLKQNNKCYVIKYKAKISDFTYYTFDLPRDYQLYDSIHNERLKINWIIERCIRIIHDNIFCNNPPEIYGFMNFDVDVPYSNIIEIYNEEKYKKKFNIEE